MSGQRGGINWRHHRNWDEAKVCRVNTGHWVIVGKNGRTLLSAARYRTQRGAMFGLKNLLREIRRNKYSSETLAKSA